MNKWSLYDPFVYSYLKKSLIGMQTIHGHTIDPGLVSILKPIFTDISFYTTYSKGAATIFPYPNGIILDIINQNFSYVGYEEVNKTLKNINYSLTQPKEILLALSAIGPEILYCGYNKHIQFKVFLPYLGRALLREYELTN